MIAYCNHWVNMSHRSFNSSWLWCVSCLVGIWRIQGGYPGSRSHRKECNRVLLLTGIVHSTRHKWHYLLLSSGNSQFLACTEGTPLVLHLVPILGCYWAGSLDYCREEEAERFGWEVHWWRRGYSYDIIMVVMMIQKHPSPLTISTNFPHFNQHSIYKNIT